MNAIAEEEKSLTCSCRTDATLPSTSSSKMFPALCAFRLALYEVMLTDRHAEETGAALQLWKQIQQQQAVPMFVLTLGLQLHHLYPNHSKQLQGGQSQLRVSCKTKRFSCLKVQVIVT